MKVAAFLTLAALAAVASAGGIQFPVHGGYNCAGAITEIRCLEDDNGLVQGISYYNEDLGGWNNFCGSDDDATADDPPGTAWAVPDGEAIIRVEACRGAKYGYINVTFYTDKDSVFTCGSGTGDYVPGGYSSSYVGYGYTKSGRKLQDAAKPLGFGSSGHGWGWDSLCQSYQSPRQPYWVRSGGVKSAGAVTTTKTPWWQGGSNWNDKFLASNKTQFNRFWGPSFYYFVANYSATPPANSHGFKGGVGWTYFTYAPQTGGTPIRYYKTWSAWKKAQNAYNRNPSAYNYKPAYYYKEVFPLASFKAICDADNYVYNLFSWCWNSKLKA